MSRAVSEFVLIVAFVISASMLVLLFAVAAFPQEPRS